MHLGSLYFIYIWYIICITYDMYITLTVPSFEHLSLAKIRSTKGTKYALDFCFDSAKNYLRGLWEIKNIQSSLRKKNYRQCYKGIWIISYDPRKDVGGALSSSTSFQSGTVLLSLRTWESPPFLPISVIFINIVLKKLITLN